MKKIAGIGACVMDTLIVLPHYPKEDTKLRATGLKTAGGGPVSTGLVAASKLGVKASYIGTLSDDGGGKFLLADFGKYGVGTDGITVCPGYNSFTSYIWLSTESTSRTCVFDKGNLPPLTLNENQKNQILGSDVLMVDGNELGAAIEGAKLIREKGGKVLYDCGGLYDGVEKLLALTDVMIPSEEFALKITGEKSAEDAAKKLMSKYHPEVVVVTQGKRGGIVYDGTDIKTYPIYPAVVVDSNGSGDVFHGAFAAGMAYGFDYIKCCHFASAVSAIKCTGIGSRQSVPDFNTVKNYMKENGYDL